MRRASLIGLLLCCTLLSVRSAVAQSSSTGQFDAQLERTLFQQANEERSKTGLAPFAWDDKLANAARLHAEKMVAENKLSHRAAGETALLDRLVEARVALNFAAENVAYSTENDDIHSGWMHSAGHRANILDPRSNAVGVGVLHTAKGFYAVEDFAHVTSSYDSDGAEKHFISAFEADRKAAHKVRTQIAQRPSLRTAACGMADADMVSAKAVPIDRGFQHALTYTASEPDEFPVQLKPLLADPGLAEMQIGACYRATRQFPGGSYWFVIVY